MEVTGPMITRFRWMGWLLAAGVLALAPAAHAAPVDRYLPEETETVCTLNVRQLLHSPVVKRFAFQTLRDVLAACPAKQVLGAVGLDPLQDIHQVVVASWGDEDDGNWAVIVHGRFDTARAAAGLKLLARAMPEKLKAHQDDGHAYWEIVGGDTNVPPGKHGSLTFLVPLFGLASAADGSPATCPSFFLRLADGLFFAVIDKSTVVIAQDRKDVQAAFARTTAGKRPAVNRDLRDLIADCDLRQTLWFAGADGVEGGLTVDEDVKFQATVYARNLEAARQVTRGIDDLRTRLAGLIMLVAGNKKDRSSLAGILQSFKDTRKGRVVTLEAQIPIDVFDELQEVLATQTVPPPPPVTPTRDGRRPEKQPPPPRAPVAERGNN
jgi:hypothetical protein